MESMIEKSPDIISAAAQSHLGILALMILVVSVIGFWFFKEEPIWARFLVFFTFVSGTAMFGGAILQISNDPCFGEDPPISCKFGE